MTLSDFAWKKMDHPNVKFHPEFAVFDEYPHKDIAYCEIYCTNELDAERLFSYMQKFLGRKYQVKHFLRAPNTVYNAGRRDTFRARFWLPHMDKVREAFQTSVIHLHYINSQEQSKNG